MADVAAAGACSCLSFAAAAVERIKNSRSVSICLNIRLCPPAPLSFKESVSRSLRTSSFQSYSRPTQGFLQITAAVGYPPSMKWWEKGNQPNMREIHSAEEFLDALSKAGDRLVLVDFFSIGCRSCKAVHPKVCQIAAENPDVVVLKVNFYDSNTLCRSLNVNILPFFHLYRGAEGRLDAFSCSLPKVNKLREAIAKHKSGCPQLTNPSVSKINSSTVMPMRTVLAVAPTP